MNDGGELSNEWRGIFMPHEYLALSSRFFRESRVAFIYSLCMQHLFPKRIGDMIKWKRGSLGGFSETGRLRQQFRHLQVGGVFLPPAHPVDKTASFASSLLPLPPDFFPFQAVQRQVLRFHLYFPSPWLR